MLHAEISESIIGAGMAVLNELKPGLDERLYENALVLELIARGKVVDQQHEYPVHYRGHYGNVSSKKIGIQTQLRIRGHPSFYPCYPRYPRLNST